MENKVDFYNVELLQKFCGIYNKNIKILEKAFDIKIKIRGNTVHIDGEHIKKEEVLYDGMVIEI